MNNTSYTHSDIEPDPTDTPMLSPSRYRNKHYYRYMYIMTYLLLVIAAARVTHHLPVQDGNVGGQVEGIEGGGDEEEAVANGVGEEVE